MMAHSWSTWIYAVILFGVISSNICLASPAQPKSNQSQNINRQLDTIYHQAQREFRRANYPVALKLMEQYIEVSKREKITPNNLIILIDKIGFIYLRVHHNPDKAIAFFKRIEKELSFADELDSVIEEWLGAAIEWKQFGTFPGSVKDPDELYSLGKNYFNKGSSQLRYTMDKSGNANFHIAASYLIPLIANFDNHPQIAQALLMMGKIRRHIILDSNYWTENYYLKEVIRRFPHTEVAQKAYKSLEESVHFGYTGSGGDTTPQSMTKMLRDYKTLAYPKPK